MTDIKEKLPIDGRKPKPIWKEWLLDISFGHPPCFVPYEKEKDEIIIGMTVLQDKCPGKLVGVCHSDGQKAVEKWCKDNPSWYKTYSQ